GPSLSWRHILGHGTEVGCRAGKALCQINRTEDDGSLVKMRPKSVVMGEKRTEANDYQQTSHDGGNAQAPLFREPQHGPKGPHPNGDGRQYQQPLDACRV